MPGKLALSVTVYILVNASTGLLNNLSVATGRRFNHTQLHDEHGKGQALMRLPLCCVFFEIDLAAGHVDVGEVHAVTSGAAARRSRIQSEAEHNARLADIG